MALGVLSGVLSIPVGVFIASAVIALTAGSLMVIGYSQSLELSALSSAFTI